MNNTHLVQYSHDGLEFLIDESSGEVYASTRGLARLVGKTVSTIHSWKGAQKIQLKSAETLTTRGLQGVRVFDENQIMEAVIKYKPDLLPVFAKAGLRVCLYGLAGYSVAPTPQFRTVAQRRDDHYTFADPQELGGFTVLDGIRIKYEQLERALGGIPDNMALEISVGLCYAKHRKSLNMEEPLSRSFMALSLKGHPIEMTLYSLEEYSYFVKWFYGVYLTEKYPSYITKKLKGDPKALQSHVKDHRLPSLGDKALKLLGI